MSGRPANRTQVGFFCPLVGQQTEAVGFFWSGEKKLLCVTQHILYRVRAIGCVVVQHNFLKFRQHFFSIPSLQIPTNLITQSFVSAPRCSREHEPRRPGSRFCGRVTVTNARP